MYRFHLSWRFLRHHWLMTCIGSFFVGASLVVLVVVMSVMDGFQQRLKDTVAGFSADYIMVPQFPADMAKLADAAEARVPSLLSAAPYHETITLVQRAGPKDPLRDKLEFAQAFGVDGLREQRVNRFGDYLRDRRGRLTVRDLSDPFKVHDRLEEKSGTKGVILSSGLMALLQVQVGEKVKIASIRRRAAESADGGPSADATDYDQKWLKYLVVGVYSTGNGDKDAHCLFLDHRVVSDLWSRDVRRSGIRAKLRPGEEFGTALRQSEAAMEALIADSVPAGTPLTPFDRRFALHTWRDENVTLMQAIESEKSMILVISFLIVVAGTSSIFAAQWLLVSDKIREIGILRALGAGVGGVITIFVTNGFVMGLIGSAGGVAVGLLVVRKIDSVKAFVLWLTGRDLFPSDIYLFKTIPTLVDHAAVVRYALAALACTLVASAIPALRAGLLDPAKALHRE